MANLLWAHATMGRQNKKLFIAVGARLLEPHFVDGCNEQDISIILWAHARIKVQKNHTRSRTASPPATAPLALGGWPRIINSLDLWFQGLAFRVWLGCWPRTFESLDVLTVCEPGLGDRHIRS